MSRLRLIGFALALVFGCGRSIRTDDKIGAGSGGDADAPSAGSTGRAGASSGGAGGRAGASSSGSSGQAGASVGGSSGDAGTSFGGSGGSAGAPPGGGWTMETIEALEYEPTDVVAALDVNGRLHVGYVDLSDHQLVHAVRSNGGWSSERVAGASGAQTWGRSIALAVAAGDELHFAFYAAGDIRHAFGRSGAWQSETVLNFSSGGGTVPAIGLAADPEVASIDILYRYALELFHAQGVWDGSGGRAWRTDPTGLRQGTNASLARAPNGVLHVAFLDDFVNTTSPPEGNYKVIHAVESSGTWVPEEIDGFPSGTTAVPSEPAVRLALDADGSPRVAYYFPRILAGESAFPGASHSELRYAAYSEGRWQIERVDGAGSFGGDLWLALDPLGAPHVSYLEVATSALFYATKREGRWIVEVVDSSGVAGRSSALVVDGEGTTSVVFVDRHARAVRVATRVE